MSGVVKEEKNVEGQETYLCSDENDDMADEIRDVMQFILGTKLENGIPIPRYGLLSLEAAITPVYVYDHPAFLKVTNTAFTDGVHVFVYAGFLRKLVEEEEESKGTEYGAEPLILHELMHKLLGHTHRLMQFPKDIANKAEDLVINSKLQLSFPQMKWTKTISELGLGFKPSEAEKYATMAEETIARQLMADEDKKKQQQQQQQGNKGQQGQQQKGQQQGNQQGQQQGGQQPGQQQGQGQGQPQDGQGGGQPQNGQGQQGNQQGQQQPGGQGGEEWSDMHTIPLEELIRICEENGLQNILDKLELPNSDQIEDIAKIEENVQMKQIENIQKAAAQKNALGGKYPGAHIVDAAAERIKGLTEGKLDWKLGLKEWILGQGMKFRNSDEEPDLLYYVDGDEMGLDNEIYIGSPLPHAPEEVVLCLIDTSGSMDQKILKQCLSEVLTLKKGVSGVSDTASEVILLSADTVLRGEPIIIDENNVDQLMADGVNIFGRGGTDLGRSLKAALKLPLLKDKKISSVLYFTDLCDTPPVQADFQEAIDKGIQLAFVTTPHTYSEEFAKAVKGFARVYPIEEGITVDLTENAMDQPVNTRQNKMK